VFALLFVIAGCKEEVAPSLYDTVTAGKPTPALASFTVNTPLPLAGVSEVTITGINFSTKNEENRVFFDAVQAVVISSSATTIKARAPVLVKDSIKIMVNVIGASAYSKPLYVNLVAAVSEFGGLAPVDEPFGIACDTAGTVYVSVLKSSSGDGIRKYQADGTQDTSFHSPSLSSSVPKMNALKIGPDGALYGVASRTFFFRIPIAGGAPAIWSVNGSLGTLVDFDFDQKGNIWAGGPTTSGDNNIYEVRNSDKNVFAVPFNNSTIRSVRVYNGYVYVGGKVDSTEGVWRFQILTDSLGAPEKYFDLSAQVGYRFNGPPVNAITFNTDGDMYLGTESLDAILLVHANKSFDVFYTGLFNPKILLFAWGKGTTLYAVKTGSDVSTSASKIIYKINTLKTSAPYYGRGDH
jgi:hypothetical protein